MCQRAENWYIYWYIFINRIYIYIFIATYLVCRCWTPWPPQSWEISERWSWPECWGKTEQGVCVDSGVASLDCTELGSDRSCSGHSPILRCLRHYHKRKLFIFTWRFIFRYLYSPFCGRLNEINIHLNMYHRKNHCLFSIKLTSAQFSLLVLILELLGDACIQPNSNLQLKCRNPRYNLAEVQE